MSCTYPPEVSSLRPSDRDPHTTVQNRIRELESLVHVLMQRAAPKNSPNVTSSIEVTQPPTEAPGPRAVEGSPDPGPGASGHVEPSDCGTLMDTPTGTSYVDAAHWTALLDSISELKDCIQDTTESGFHYQIPSQVIPDYGPSPQLLYGRFAPASKSEILSTLPARSVVDRLIFKFFNAVDLAPALVHTGQFIRQYDDFWQDPSSAPIMWVGLMFAIMCLSSLFSLPHAAHDPTNQRSDLEGAVLVRVYREKVVQCLTLGKYTGGGPHVLQTLILYIAIEHLLQEDSEFGTHLLLSMILNLAMRMGYHRDPKNFPVISAFDGEMRRRIWAAIFQANLIFASQMGLPSMLKDYHVDTEEPHNILDTDFDEGSAELPLSRPETELTPVLYIITRSRVARLWEKVRDVATDTRVHKYEEILAMDDKVQAYQRNIPLPLRMQPIAQSLADPPHTIMQRIWLEICFLRLQIVLHKKYFIAPDQHERYNHSRSVSVKAAMKILQHQHLVHELVSPDGLLYEARWKLSSIMNNEFLLATSIICAYLKQIIDTPESVVEGISIEEINQLLMNSMECWKKFSITSRNARRAVEAIRLVLQVTGTPISSPTEIEEELNPMAFQDPLLLDLHFPCPLNTFYNGEDLTSGGHPSLTPTSFPQQPADDEWINLFQRVSTRIPD
ncbi:uncharacterized protein F4822DRAFT_443484 [Hypoxylon trugodes]|uniref:uncharacterized protein n=1 Tax=Hypoxylon trugodes TaxID=326681 RepID=UPI0021905502|nr:uncharacterized protein F4822DRAFT_443484 [Hypoxylon trugodes]KAI1388576.1 hypothetical protein F4822DRAFT_443484 [Hypoxylon trugodes]